MGWQKGVWNCSGADATPSAPCVPRSSECTCNRGGLIYELTGPAGQDWAERWPLLAATVDDERCANAAEVSSPRLRSSLSLRSSMSM